MTVTPDPELVQVDKLGLSRKIADGTYRVTDRKSAGWFVANGWAHQVDVAADWTTAIGGTAVKISKADLRQLLAGFFAHHGPNDMLIVVVQHGGCAWTPHRTDIDDPADD